MKKDNRSVIQTLTLIFQFGISMLVPIFLCSILGVWLGNLTGINWLMIPFFFMHLDLLAEKRAMKVCSS